MDQRPLLKYEDVADRVNLSKRHVQRLVHLDLIPHVKIGRAVRFSPDDLDAWLRARSKGVPV